MQDEWDILESLSPGDRDRYTLVHLQKLKRMSAGVGTDDGNEDEDEDEDLLFFDPKTSEVIDMGVMNKRCCDAPQFVMDERSHDQICTNCGDANHCGTMQISNKNMHWECLQTGCIITRAYYKRITHFRRTLRDFQGGCVVVPPSLMQDVKQHVALPATEKGVLLYLKEIRSMRYYSQARFISLCLGNTSPVPILTSHQTEVLTRLFMRYSTAFDEFKRSEAGERCTRKNFLSYTFILRQLCQEMQYTHLVPFIRPLKCKKTVAFQMAIWEQLPRFFATPRTSL